MRKLPKIYKIFLQKRGVGAPHRPNLEKIMGYIFAQFDSRPQGAENNNSIVENAKGGAALLGIEVTIPSLAEKCSLGNLDHHRVGDDSTTPSACEQAMDAEIPPDGTTLVTVRSDADSITAMAVLASRRTGRRINSNLVGRVDQMDRLGPAAVGCDEEVVAIARQASNSRLSMKERVRWVQNLLAGEDMDAEVADLVAARDREFKEALADSDVTTVADGRIAVVVSTHRFATALGYQHANLLVCYNPQMPLNFQDPSAGTYKKFTVCRHDSYVLVDLKSALAQLQVMEEGWGGRGGDIFGSPQGVSSKLDLATVIKVVKSHLR